jgi:hypothetical protein
VGSGGVRSRVRTIFLIFHNPMVRPVTFGGSVLPQASIIAVKATHVRGMLAPPHPLRDMWVMRPWAGAPAPHSPQRILRKMGIDVNLSSSEWGGVGAGSRTAHGPPTELPKGTLRGFPGCEGRGARKAAPLPWLLSLGTAPSLQRLPFISPAVQAILYRTVEAFAWPSHAHKTPDGCSVGLPCCPYQQRCVTGTPLAD